MRFWTINLAVETPANDYHTIGSFNYALPLFLYELQLKA